MNVDAEWNKQLWMLLHYRLRREDHIHYTSLIANTTLDRWTTATFAVIPSTDTQELCIQVKKPFCIHIASFNETTKQMDYYRCKAVVGFSEQYLAVYVLLINLLSLTSLPNKPTNKVQTLGKELNVISQKSSFHRTSTVMSREQYRTTSQWGQIFSAQSIIVFFEGLLLYP